RARAAGADPRLLEPMGTSSEVMERLMKLPGFGPWTAQYWALRALHDSDAFPAADVGLLRSAVVARGGKRPTPAALLARAERWRPWRAYAAPHPWASGRDAAHGEEKGEMPMSDARVQHAAQFRALHAGPELLVLPNAWDAGSARVIEHAGARAIATSSAAVAWGHGYPDGQALPLDMVLATVR